MAPIDYIQLILGFRDELTPSKGILFVGGGDFEEIGEGFLKHFIEFGKLAPEHKVLDVGCGIGRMAVPLTRYINDKGNYDGFDVFEEGIKWCQKKITKKFPNFKFTLADIYNGEYNPGGKLKASEYNFPYGDQYFDFAFTTSVFTHMMQEDLENYISELSRVMKKGGRCLITFFLLNQLSISLIEQKKSTLNFILSKENFSVLKRKVPEYTVAYREEYIRSIFTKNSFAIIEPIKYGSWCGSENFFSRQDISLIEKI